MDDVLPQSCQDPRIQSAIAHLKGLLISSEKIVHLAAQLRWAALTHRRILVAATTGRFIMLDRGLLGGFTMTDVRWQDLRDARFDEGMLPSLFGAGLTIESAKLRPFVVAGLAPEDGRPLYVFCQEQEQAWREKNRLRQIEEERARSGGMILGAQPGAVAPQVASAAIVDPTERLQKAKEMLDQGLLSDTEFETIKARIINDL